MAKKQAKGPREITSWWIVEKLMEGEWFQQGRIHPTRDQARDVRCLHGRRDEKMRVRHVGYLD